MSPWSEPLNCISSSCLGLLARVSQPSLSCVCGWPSVTKTNVLFTSNLFTTPPLTERGWGRHAELQKSQGAVSYRRPPSTKLQHPSLAVRLLQHNQCENKNADTAQVLTDLSVVCCRLKLSNEEMKRAILTMDEQEDLPKDMLEQVRHQVSYKLNFLFEMCFYLVIGSLQEDVCYCFTGRNLWIQGVLYFVRLKKLYGRKRCWIQSHLA